MDFFLLKTYILARSELRIWSSIFFSLWLHWKIILFSKERKNKEGGSRKGNLLVEIFVVGSGSFQFSLWWLFEDYAVSPRVCPLICFRVSSFFCFFSCWLLLLPGFLYCVSPMGFHIARAKFHPPKYPWTLEIASGFGSKRKDTQICP